MPPTSRAGWQGSSGLLQGRRRRHGGQWERPPGVLVSKVGDSETETSRRKSSAQLKHPREPGLDGVRLVISNAHTGLTQAIRRQLKWLVCQRCRGAFGSATGAIVVTTCCSAPPKLTMAWSRPPWAAWSPRKALRRSSHAGKVWPPRWRSASPRHLAPCTRPR